MFTEKIIEKIRESETRSSLLFYILCKYRFNRHSPKQIREHQLKRMRYIASYASDHSEFFHEWYKDRDLSSPLVLPTVNKKIMMGNFSKYNTVGLDKTELIDFCLEIEETRDFSKRLKGYSVAMSSGTSGSKGVEIVSKEEENYMRAALLARFDRPKCEKLNIVFILRVSSPALNLDKFGHKVSYISLLDPLDKIIDELIKIQPNVLAAPASMLKILAHLVEEGRLNIKPKRVVTYAEVMDQNDRELISKIFGVVVHEIYKATEGPIGITCKHGSLHINEDLVCVQLYNEDGSECPPGKASYKMVVTDLYKRTQPIIRYELNDIITIDTKSCPCGSSYRVIKRVQGRMDDLFWCKNRSTGKWEHIFPDQIRRAVIRSSEDISEYMVTQVSPTELTVTLELIRNHPQDRFDKETLIRNIQKVFGSRDLIKPNVEISFTDHLRSMNANKFRRIKREFDHEQ